jgi:hypothetical protein
MLTLTFFSAYNYELDNKGACQLVPGYQPQSLEEFCKANPTAIEYFEPTGYRRIPLTTCRDGLQFDRASGSRPCPGHQDEYERAHVGPSGFTVFLAVTLPFAAAGAIGWWVFRNWSGSFGQIRLGESPRGGLLGGDMLDSDRPWVRYPIIAVSAAVAVIGALPLIAMGIWRAASSAAERLGVPGFGGSRGAWSRLGGGGVGGARRFTTRDSFARGGEYDIVDDDEGELLGEDSDEEA